MITVQKKNPAGINAPLMNNFDDIVRLIKGPII